MVALPRSLHMLGVAAGACMAVACNSIAGLDGLSFSGSGGASTGAGGDATTSVGGSGSVGGGGTGGTTGTGGTMGTGGLGPTYAAEVMTDLPTSYWRLDDTNATAVDAMGNHDGAYEGGLLLGQPGMLPNSTAVTFEDNNDRVVVDSGPFGFEGTTSFSVEAWFRTLSDGGQIVSKMTYADGSGYAGWFLCLNTAGPGVRFARHIAGGGNIAGGDPIDDDMWHHVVAVHDGDQGVSILYLDAEKIGDQPQTNPLPAVPDPLQIGDGNNWGNFDGTIDEVAIYEHVLTPVRIEAHYEAGLKGMGAP